jgi:adenylate cyclase
MLDGYFECIASAIEERQGEILKFIGDAVLAIFPFDGGNVINPSRRALSAAADGLERLSAWNAGRESRGEAPVKIGIALHVGEVMYGNIGGRKRLDFTVIGGAVNEASRIESLCKELGQELLLSEAFVKAAKLPNVESLGRHVLRGVGQSQEIFVVKP